MLQATQTAATGLRAQQTRMDTIAANIANENTVGYKAARVDFKDALYTRMKDPVGTSEKNNLLRGSGVLLNATGRDLTNGTLQTTDSSLDFSITGEGYFTLENGNGERMYTRNGHFSVSEENGRNYLVNENGYYVLSNRGQRIELAGTGDVSVSEDGTLTRGGRTIAQLGITEFANPQGLDAAGNSCFQATAASGRTRAAQNAKISQGSLESSNVNLGEEMTLMIRAQRVYTMAGKALQTADDMDGLANNLR